MLPALASGAILVAQCTGPYCAPDTDFERPTLGAMGTAAAPALAVAADGAVLLLWEARIGGEPDVLFSRREPGPAGAWLEAPVRLDTDAPGASRSIEPRLAAGPGELVYAVWQDARAGRDAILFSRSTDGGLAWSPEETRFGGGEATASMASLAAARDAVFVAWEDLRDGERDIRLARSSDRGETWTDDERVGTDEAGYAASYHPQLLAWDGGGLLVVWWDERAGLADLYVRRSEDGGRTWAGAEARLDPGEPGEVASRDARIAVAGDRVVVAWREGGIGTPRLLTRASEDRGATWSPVRGVGRGRHAVPIVGASQPAWLAWLSEDAGGQGEKTSIGGRIVEVSSPVRFLVQAVGVGQRSISSLPGPASVWGGAAGDRLWAVRTGTLVGRAVLEVFEHRGTDWRSALQLRFGLDLLATDVEITAHSLRGAIGADGAVHVAWIADYDGAGDVGYFRLQP